MHRNRLSPSHSPSPQPPSGTCTLDSILDAIDRHHMAHGVTWAGGGALAGSWGAARRVRVRPKGAQAAQLDEDARRERRRDESATLLFLFLAHGVSCRRFVLFLRSRAYGLVTEYDAIDYDYMLLTSTRTVLCIHHRHS